MDILEQMICIAAGLFIAYTIIEEGTLCAQKVWDRTKAELDEIDLLEAAHVPSVSNLEALLIYVAATLRAFYMLPLALWKEYQKQPWQKTPEQRRLDLELSLCTDILGAVSSMLSGYPERAKHLYWRERGERLAEQYDALRRDYEAQLGGGESPV